MELIFATNNSNKAKEIQQKVSKPYIIKSLKDIGFNEDIPEDYFTLKENAEVKADTIFNLTGKNCFADDTGLEVDALNGEPGVFSARYAGEHGNSLANIEKLLNELGDIENRTARFRTVICIIFNGEKLFFEGIAEGSITKELHGIEGFGYDPIFIPKGHEKTFAQMPIAKKNKISHRAKAFEKMLAFLKEQ
ncbi:MAG: RdgB/HAM1 family non-canonical purine NTP pyrophosphatase [Bacteroidia bacterium]